MKLKLFVFIFLVLVLSSCDKGYQVRFRNYLLTPMDSVIIGDQQVVFTDIDTKGTTEYKKISRGRHGVTLVSKNKLRFYTYLPISGKGEGNKTLQIDAIGQIAVLDE